MSIYENNQRVKDLASSNIEQLEDIKIDRS